MEENRTGAFSYKIQKFLLSFQHHGLIINVLFDWAMSFQLCDDPSYPNLDGQQVTRKF